MIRYFNKFINYLGLALAYMRFNLRAQLEYRQAFISQVVAMFVNDAFWVVFWCLFFTKFPVVRGWTSKDVITLWAINAAGYGIAFSFFRNVNNIPYLIARGQLDSWMLYPRALLPHLLVGTMSATAIGDAIFGYAVYGFFIRPDIPHMLLFVLLSFGVALVFVSFSILVGSLSFYLGNVEALGDQMRGALVAFSTYPASIFDGAIKLILFSFLPAGFVGYLPAQALRELSFIPVLEVFAGGFVMSCVATFVFYYGLSRYESGSLMEMRG